MLKNIFKKAINYVYCMSLIMVSGNPALRLLDLELLTILLFLTGLTLFLFRPIYVTARGCLLVTLATFLLFIQISVFGEVAVNASVGFLLQMLIAFMVVSSIPRFLEYFTNCMFVIALVSLPIFLAFQVYGSPASLDSFIVFSEASGVPEINIGIHHFRGYKGAIRNSGPFWEPGAFAGYLAIALFCMVLLTERQRQSALKAAVILAALLTTLSTMGYVALVTVAFAYFVQKFRSSSTLTAAVTLPIFAVILGFGAFTAAKQIPFLQEKIVAQIDDAEGGEENSEINRFGNAEYDLQFIKERPLFGWSANVDTRAQVDPLAYSLVSGQGNALSGLAARFGIIGWLLFMGSFFLAYYRASSSIVLAGIGFSLLAITFTGEKYMNYPLIMTMMFLERHHIFPRTLVRRRSSSKQRVNLAARLGNIFRSTTT